jgi:SH3 domain-binding glutamic acid-rich protein
VSTLSIASTHLTVIFCSEDAVEFNELSRFLRLDDAYDPEVEEERPLLQSSVIGVPGVATSLQMTPERLRPALLAGSSSSSPLSGKAAIPVNKRDDEFDVSTELSGFGLQGVKVSEDDLAALVKELGLEGDDATDLVKGLGYTTTPAETNAPATHVDSGATTDVADAKPTNTDADQSA